MKQKKILIVLYALIVVTIIVSIIDVSVVNHIKTEYLIENNFNINEIETLVRKLKIVYYIPTFIIIGIGIITLFINKRKFQILSIILLIVASFTFISKNMSFEDKILSERGGDALILDYEVEDFLTNKNESNIESFLDILNG